MNKLASIALLVVLLLGTARCAPPDCSSIDGCGYCTVGYPVLECIRCKIAKTLSFDRKTCDAATTCSGGGTLQPAGVCATCNVLNCVSCIVGSVCLTCSNGMLVAANGLSCISSCPAGQESTSAIVKCMPSQPADTASDSEIAIYIATYLMYFADQVLPMPGALKAATAPLLIRPKCKCSSCPVAALAHSQSTPLNVAARLAGNAHAALATPSDALISKSFAVFDADSDGYITINELKAALTKYTTRVGDLTQATYSMLLVESDANDKISLTEWQILIPVVAIYT